MFSVHTTLEKFEKASSVILDLRLKKSREGKSGHLDVIVFEEFSDSSSLRFRKGLLCSVGL